LFLLQPLIPFVRVVLRIWATLGIKPIHPVGDQSQDPERKRGELMSLIELLALLLEVAVIPISHEPDDLMTFIASNSSTILLVPKINQIMFSR